MGVLCGMRSDYLPSVSDAWVYYEDTAFIERYDYEKTGKDHCRCNCATWTSEGHPHKSEFGTWKVMVGHR